MSRVPFFSPSRFLVPALTTDKSVPRARPSSALTLLARDWLTDRLSYRLGEGPVAHSLAQLLARSVVWKNESFIIAWIVFWKLCVCIYMLSLYKIWKFVNNVLGSLSRENYKLLLNLCFLAFRFPPRPLVHQPCPPLPCVLLILYSLMSVFHPPSSLILLDLNNPLFLHLIFMFIFFVFFSLISFFDPFNSLSFFFALIFFYSFFIFFVLLRI